jgi:predicted RecB family endonuclease
VTLDLMLEDGDGINVLHAMARAGLAGTVIVISGMNAARRTAARSLARSLGIELASLLHSAWVLSVARFMPASLLVR